MIKFFRKIRQNLITQNRINKYLIYAFGEIVLVVIGILIALQINNWNEQKNKKNLEKVIVININSEFKNNKIKLTESINQYNNIERSIRYLMSRMKFTKEELEKENIDSIISKAVDVFEYHPTQNTIKELLSTGNLNLITNDSLKFHLLNWSSEIEELDEAWETLDDFNQNMLLPYLTKYASMRNIDKYSLMKWKENSKFTVDYEFLFNDIQFENHLDNVGWSVINYRMSLHRLNNLINQIIRLTND